MSELLGRFASCYTVIIISNSYSCHRRELSNKICRFRLLYSFFCHMRELSRQIQHRPVKHISAFYPLGMWFLNLTWEEGYIAVRLLFPYLLLPLGHMPSFSSRDMHLDLFSARSMSASYKGVGLCLRPKHIGSLVNAFCGIEMV